MYCVAFAVSWATWLLFTGVPALCVVLCVWYLWSLGNITQAPTCQNLNLDTAYILHYIYTYLTQGQQEPGLIALSPRAKCIISKGIGVYATPILQPTSPVAHLTTGLAIHAYLPMNPCSLQSTSPADLVFFTDASGESALTPITGGATLQLTQTE